MRAPDSRLQAKHDGLLLTRGIGSLWLGDCFRAVYAELDKLKYADTPNYTVRMSTRSFSHSSYAYGHTIHSFIPAGAGLLVPSKLPAYLRPAPHHIKNSFIPGCGHYSQRRTSFPWLWAKAPFRHRRHQHII